jgi:hypothetical protein
MSRIMMVINYKGFQQGSGKNVQGAAEITPTFRKITVASPKQVVGCGPFR